MQKLLRVRLAVGRVLQRLIKNVWVWRGSWSSRPIVFCRFQSPPSPSPLTGISITRVNKQGTKCKLYLYHRDITAPSPHLTLIPHPSRSLLPGGRGGDHDELLHQPQGCFCHGKELFLSSPLNERVFPSSLLAFHPPHPLAITHSLSSSMVSELQHQPRCWPKRNRNQAKSFSSRYYFKAGFPAVITGCCSARDSQSPTLKSEQSSRLTSLGSATGEG